MAARSVFSVFFVSKHAYILGCSSYQAMLFAYGVCVYDSEAPNVLLFGL